LLLVLLLATALAAPAVDDVVDDDDDDVGLMSFDDEVTEVTILLITVVDAVLVFVVSVEETFSPW